MPITFLVSSQHKLETFKYTWDMFEEDVRTIILKVDFSNYDLIVGVSKGGLPLLTKLSNITGLPYEIIKCKSYENREQKELQIGLNTLDIACSQRILLVDDVADTGKTLEALFKHLNTNNRTCDILTLCYKSHSIILPKWYLREVPSCVWIDFAWE